MDAKPHVDAQLDTLEAKGLIKLASLQPELEYLFRHVLVQDAAYGSLLKQERRELHRRVGEALEGLYPERGSELAGVLAMHFEQAGDAERALRYLVAEGRYALDRNALTEAYAAFDRALPYLPAEDTIETTHLRVEIEVGRARAGFAFRHTADVIAELSAVLPAAESTGDLELIAQVHLHLALVRIESGHKAMDPAVQESLKRVTDIGAELDDPSLGALPLALVGVNKVFIGPTREGVAQLELAVPLMEKRRNSIGVAFARGWLAIGYANLGEFDRAEQASRYATEQAAKGDLIAQIDAQIAAAVVHSQRGRLDEALPIAQKCLADSEQGGATACAVVSAWMLGDIYQRQGRFEEARDALGLGIRLAPVTGADRVWRPTLTAWMGTNNAILGEPDTDPAAWEGALATSRQIDNKLGEAGILWKRAEARAKLADWPAAFADFEAGASIWEADGSRPNLARTLRSWGDALRASGHAAEADEKHRRALELFVALGLEREAGEVRSGLSG